MAGAPYSRTKDTDCPFFLALSFELYVLRIPKEPVEEPLWEDQQPAPVGPPCKWTTRGVGRPASVKPSDDSNLTIDPEPKVPS